MESIFNTFQKASVDIKRKQIAAFWDVTPSSFVVIYLHFLRWDIKLCFEINKEIRHMIGKHDHSLANYLLSKVRNMFRLNILISHDQAHITNA